jgi:acyl dehydratase
MRHFDTLADLRLFIGRPLGHSDWITVDQPRVNAFAEATEDRQWIHVDPERAQAGPFGGPIAHGFLTLSLIPYFFETGFAVRESRMVLNYGLNKVRFTAPVPVGSRLRAAFKLLAMDDVAGGAVQLTVEVAVEAEGAAKPVCVAESLARHYR